MRLISPNTDQPATFVEALKPNTLMFSADQSHKYCMPELPAENAEGAGLFLKSRLIVGERW